MNKKIFLILTMLFLICTSTLAATAKVQINGNVIDFTDSNGAKVDAQIINSRTMVPKNYFIFWKIKNFMQCQY